MTRSWIIFPPVRGGRVDPVARWAIALLVLDSLLGAGAGVEYGNDDGASRGSSGGPLGELLEAHCQWDVGPFL